jgi:hypothetical protein
VPAEYHGDAGVVLSAGPPRRTRRT